MSKQREDVACDLNNRLHKQAKTVIASFQNSTDGYTKFSIDSLSKLLDPVLLDFIQKITQAVRFKRCKLFNESEVSHKKSVRQLFLLCSLMFITNTQCSMPFHVLNTEAILCYGGSHELVKIFNRLGAAASLDTSLRLATQVVQDRMVSVVKPELEEGALSIISIAHYFNHYFNIILQSHAFVSCTDATRSWHGTSVQCVQLLPHSALLKEEEMLPLNVESC